ncbi:MAG: T9SS type A sorting domain-containing protein [Saprospiraceae bacterium]|nr:T9SS type A sorting domain-containing protein [Saprospiraceae bacterium]
MKLRVGSAVILLFLIANLLSQQIYDARQSILVQATVQENPPRIILNWVRDTANGGYTICRKSKYDRSWTDSLARLSPSSVSWTDTTVKTGIAYEYKIIKSLPAFPYGNGAPNFGTGFIYSGIRVPPLHHRGTCLVVIDNSFKQLLAIEISRLMEDIEADGLLVDSIFVSRNDSVRFVRDRIRNWSIQQRDSNQSVFLLGRIPVPYSGNIVPDGHHNDHWGAWPCDGYYADINGTWTDQTVNANPPGSRNDNRPGDGKFDNSVIPVPVKIQIGRVDFANMTKFAESEEQLLRRYLDKDHQWRKGRVIAKERALIDNNFGDIEGLGSVGWKNFTPMFGISQVKDLPFRQTLLSQSYMWAYGCGGGGPESASDISSTTSFASDSLQVIFMMLFGSYFGDWDYPNNFLRATIASRTCLASTWGNRPSWMFHHMALGEQIGYAAQLTMNNRGLYDPPYYGGFAHTALLGDPTLKMYNHSPVENLQIKQNGLHVQLDWKKPANSIGYFVYKKTISDSLFLLLNQNPITTETYVDSCAGQGMIQFQVRSVELRMSASGTFYNLSPGVIASIQKDDSNYKANADFQSTLYYDELILKNNSVNSTSFVWNFGDGLQSTEVQPTHLYVKEGNYNICLYASDGCVVDNSCQQVNVVSSLPKVTAMITDVDCYGAATGSIQLQTSGGTPAVQIKWLHSLDTGRFIKGLTAGSYSCEIISETGNRSLYGPFIVKQAQKWNLNAIIVPTDPGQMNGSILLIPQGGCSPYEYKWSTGQTSSSINGLAIGVYCVTISDCNSCVDTFCADILFKTGVNHLTGLKKVSLYPNPAFDELELELEFDDQNEVKVELYDANSKYIQAYFVAGKEINLKLNLSTIPQGAYWIKINKRNGFIWLPFTKTGN